MDRLLLRAHFSVTDVQFNKPLFIFSLFPPSSHVAIFIVRDVIEKAVLLRRVVSHEFLPTYYFLSLAKANTTTTHEQYKSNKHDIPFVTETLSGSQMTSFETIRPTFNKCRLSNSKIF